MTVTEMFHQLATNEERLTKLEYQWAAMRDRIDTEQAKCEWQPIETAPKDGTLFLAIKAGGVYQIGSMGKRTWNAGLPSEQVRDEFLIFPQGIMWNPSHWMPLPPPPEKSS